MQTKAAYFLNERKNKEEDGEEAWPYKCCCVDSFYSFSSFQSRSCCYRKTFVRLVYFTLCVCVCVFVCIIEWLSAGFLPFLQVHLSLIIACLALSLLHGKRGTDTEKDKRGEEGEERHAWCLSVYLSFSPSLLLNSFAKIYFFPMFSIYVH